mmetsp:Transcript_22848/g.38098  ORF Transcript_22848/g.38098 Transcript_22848/m.38098 type:complete len:420 (+) Transcript_22848:3147-4406(+)
MSRQEVPRLAGRDHKDRAVGVREIIDAPISRPMHVLERSRPAAARAPAQERVVTPRCGLPNIHEIAQQRHFAQNLMVMGGLMRVAPTQAFQLGAPCLFDPQQRVIQRQSRHVRAGFNRCRLAHIAPDRRPIHVPEHPLDKERFYMRQGVGHRPQFIADQTILHGAQPGRIDQWLGPVFVHLSVPLRQKRQRSLALSCRRALCRGLTGEPQFGPDQRQKRPCREGHGVKLRLDKAVARVDLARLHQALPALDALGVAPFKADMVGKGTVDGLVVGVAQNAAKRRDKAGIGAVGHAPLPAVLGLPAQRGHAPQALVGGVAAWDRTNGLHRDAAPIHQRHVLCGRDIHFGGCDGFGHGLGAHHAKGRLQRGVARAEHRPAESRHMARRCDSAQIAEAAGQNRAVVRPAQRERDRIGIGDLDD